MTRPNLRPRITRRNFLRGFGLLSASAALAACAQATDSSSSEQGDATSAATSDVTGASAAVPMLAIIHTNDTHGHDVEVQKTDDEDGNFSMAAVASLKADWEKKGYEVFLVDAGDASQGMPLVDTSNGATAIAFMNSCGYDLMAAGNHEFDWGAEKLAENEKAAKFPILSANVLNKSDGKPRFTENKVFELADGTKVGFFGLTTPTTRTSSSPKNVTDFTFLQSKDLYDCAQAQVDLLRDQGCALVICVGHLGNEADAGDNTSKAVLENVKGIDLFIDGHDHEEVEEEVAGALLVETGCYLHNIGVVAIDNGAPANEPVPYGTYEGIDSATQAIIDEENDKVMKELNVVLGETAFLLDGNRKPGVRTQETNLGDFCADALRWTAEQELGKTVDCGIMNGGGIRTSIEPGDITLGKIKTVMPFANDLAVVEVTGAQLLEALEAATQTVGVDAIGAFPQVSQIKYTVDASVPYEEGPAYPDTTVASPAKPGSRVKITEVAGKPFDMAATYSVAATSFLCLGGDTYYVFKEASQVKQPTTFGFDYEAFVSYLVVECDHKVPDAYAQPQGRITINGA